LKFHNFNPKGLPMESETLLGKHAALRIALITLVRCLPPGTRAQFEYALPININGLLEEWGARIPPTHEFLQALSKEGKHLLAELQKPSTE